MDDDTKSILLDSVYAPLELPKYSSHTALIMLIIFNSLSISIAIIWNFAFATYWLYNQFHYYGLFAILHFAFVILTVIGGLFVTIAIIKTSVRLFKVQIFATTLNWLSSVLCAIAGTTFLAAGRMECVKWAKFRYFIAHDIDAWKFRIVGCQQYYFTILTIVNWIALLIHSGAIYSIVEYKECLRGIYPEFSNHDRSGNRHI
uniref:MARVEL domain-containing protein n=1 Tax=Parascaris univalens TaxID=6257 RepID=A0A915AJB6_PARUN